jgi:NAD(P)-dependent dehydrogenase (short-subunit alcohol dehydrogenase family)
LFAKEKNYWALVLGGSSGIGLASAKKLAQMGMNIFIVHRDRRGAMDKITPEFESIRALGVKLVTCNTNALTAEGRSEVLSQIADKIGSGSIHLVLHSIALGNLKLLAPIIDNPDCSVSALASTLGIDAGRLQQAIDSQFEGGATALADLATPPPYNQDLLCNEEDFAQTIYNMGTSLVSWVQDLFTRKMFSENPRIIGLTSEGNEIAWRAYAAVSAAKASLEAVARAIAVEYAPYGIRCNILQPGVTDTAALQLIPGSAHMKAKALQRNPCRRLTTPQDVAGVVGLMAMDEASWINGAVIRVDGGEHISG